MTWLLGAADGTEPLFIPPVLSRHENSKCMSGKWSIACRTKEE